MIANIIFFGYCYKDANMVDLIPTEDECFKIYYKHELRIPCDHFKMPILSKAHQDPQFLQIHSNTDYAKLNK
ncbi:hypothetical protein KFK09_023886 [Dendrobium nobile]|uniref:Uncharacterized protein n=1 Tax=Dendrobium nobile TaxID=94219 RepID=A0A8T3ACH3_DENNO|nr:hypothetical protein KFK09_023886 [Dendrobium nobile]